MKRSSGAAVLCALLVAACNPFDGGAEDVDRGAVLERYVEAWAVGGPDLERTVAGDDADELVTALRGLRDGGVVRTTLLGRPRAEGRELEGAVALHFADGGTLELTIRAAFTGARVRARPTAVSTKLTGWERLRIEPVGPAPTRGDILSRSGTLLARGPKDRRSVPGPALAPTVTIIDEALDGRLGGTQGRLLLAGNPPQTLASSRTVDGEHVRTSLDDTMQEAAETALGGAKGAFVAVDPRTAGIRALVSNATAQEPGRSPATSGYSPGSAFKIVTAAAALEGDVFQPTDTIGCPGRIFVEQRFITNFESIAYGSITFEKAFAVSCNTAFAQVGMRVGTVPLLRTAEGLGFRVVPKLDGAGTIAVPRNRAELGVWSFGAAGSVASPVQMAAIGTTIARGGTWLEPGWTDRDGAGTRVLKPRTAATLVALMEEVVASGTGTNAALPGARIAGKTGTADPQQAGRRSDAWFVGLAPSHGTRVVVVAFLLGAGIGGEVAAPVVRDFLAATESAWQ